MAVWGQPSFSGLAEAGLAAARRLEKRIAIQTVERPIYETKDEARTKRELQKYNDVTRLLPSAILVLDVLDVAPSPAHLLLVRLRCGALAIGFGRHAEDVGRGRLLLERDVVRRRERGDVSALVEDEDDLLGCTSSS